VSRAVVYIRVSTSEQVENFSLDTQERACREYCDREELDVDRVFREEGESAKTANRPKLQELLVRPAVRTPTRRRREEPIGRNERQAHDSQPV
jgi:predicted site-specific integrase-resolvase